MAQLPLFARFPLFAQQSLQPSLRLLSTAFALGKAPRDSGAFDFRGQDLPDASYWAYFIREFQ
jgi:hypothetical protein